MNLEYFLYPDCVLVSGVTRSAIYDLTRSKILFIPNSLFNILDEEGGFPYSKLKRQYAAELDTIDEYLDFLVVNEFIYKSTSGKLFNATDKNFETPYLIDNIIIDSDNQSNHNYEKIAKEIEVLGCPFLYFRFYSLISVKDIISVLSHFLCTRIKDVTLLLPYQPNLAAGIKRNLTKIRAVSKVIFHSAPYVKSYISSDVSFNFVKKEITDETHCGAINIDNFSVNIDMFLDSRQYNNCLHKKVSIDRRGNIKNCPSLSRVFGHIDSDSLIDAINKKGFKDLWYIKKDDIDVCKFCEFRYACLDCRAYVGGNIYSKPLKCKYDINKENDENSLYV